MIPFEIFKIFKFTFICSHTAFCSHLCGRKVLSLHLSFLKVLSQGFLLYIKRQVSYFLELSELNFCPNLSERNLLKIIFASIAVRHIMNINILSKLSNTTFKEEPTGIVQCVCHCLNWANHPLLPNLHLHAHYPVISLFTRVTHFYHTAKHLLVNNTLHVAYLLHFYST